MFVCQNDSFSSCLNKRCYVFQAIENDVSILKVFNDLIARQIIQRDPRPSTRSLHCPRHVKYLASSIRNNILSTHSLPQRHVIIPNKIQMSRTSRTTRKGATWNPHFTASTFQPLRNSIESAARGDTCLITRRNSNNAGRACTWRKAKGLTR